MQQIQNLRSFTAIFWLGFFMAISFMETPLKFTVPGISMAQGVALGRIVFGALNKCEWIFFLILLATWFLNRPIRPVTALISVIGLILILQTFWLLPLLDERAEQLIQETTPPESHLHFTYVLLEIVKVPVLFVIGWKSVNRRLLFN